MIKRLAVSKGTGTLREGEGARRMEAHKSFQRDSEKEK